MQQENILQQTPLYQKHCDLRAKMVPFGGWDMPVQYQGIIAEYHAAREHVAIFDICHMGEFIVEGDAAGSGLNRIVTQRIQDMPPGSCRYGMMLNEQGGVIDDLIVFRLQENKWMLVVNASTAVHDAEHLRKNLKDPASFSDISSQTGKIDVQGPESRDFLRSLVAGIERLDYYTCDLFDVLGQRVVVSRTGYTGELGYEIYFPSDKIADLWDYLIGKGAVPCGLGARDLLRIEMGYPLYGHEISRDIFPLDAGLERFVNWEKDFIGKTALLKYKEKGRSRKLMGFISDSRRSPRESQKIFSQNKKEIGIVTSGTFSPSLSRGVGLGFVPVDMSVGCPIFFGAENTMAAASIVSRPIYKNGTLKA